MLNIKCIKNSVLTLKTKRRKKLFCGESCLHNCLRFIFIVFIHIHFIRFYVCVYLLHIYVFYFQLFASLVLAFLINMIFDFFISVIFLLRVNVGFTKTSVARCYFRYDLLAISTLCVSY